MDGKEIEAKRRLLRQYRELGQPESALRFCRDLLERQPAQAWLWLERAGLEKYLLRREEALASLARGETLLGGADATDLLEMRLRLVRLYRELKAPERAHAFSLLLVRMNPQASWAWKDKAAIEREMGAVEEAIRSLEKASALSGDYSDLHGVAMQYQELRLYPKALRLLRNLVAARPKDAGLRHDLGLCEFLAGSPERALPHLEAAVALEPRLLPPILNLGYVYSSRGRRSEALELYEAALRRPPLESEEPALRAKLVASRDALKARRP